MRVGVHKRRTAMNASRRAVAGLALVLVLASASSWAGASVPDSDPLGGAGQQSIAAITKFGGGYLAVGSDQPAGQSYANPVVWTVGATAPTGLAPATSSRVLGRCRISTGSSRRPTACRSRSAASPTTPGPKDRHVVVADPGSSSRPTAGATSILPPTSRRCDNRTVVRTASSRSTPSQSAATARSLASGRRPALPTARPNIAVRSPGSPPTTANRGRCSISRWTAGRAA